MNRNIRIDPNGPCPCNEGRVAINCCLHGNSLYKSAPNILPPPPKSNYTHSNCYLRATNNCSQKLSAEHYVSRSLFNAFKGVDVSGAPWLAPGEHRIIGLDNLTARILCERHNNALSPLDATASRFFQTVEYISEDLARKTLSRKHRMHLFSGSALEAWLLKVACGTYFARISAVSQNRLIDTHHFNIEQAGQALLAGAWPPGTGLYVRAPVREVVTIDGTIAFAPLFATEQQAVTGQMLKHKGLHLAVLFDARYGAPLTRTDGWVPRPTEIVYTNGTRSHVIRFSWQMPVPENSITFTRRYIKKLIE